MNVACGSISLIKVSEQSAAFLTFLQLSVGKDFTSTETSVTQFTETHCIAACE